MGGTRIGMALVHGSGPDCILKVLQLQAGVIVDAISEAESVQVRKVPIPDSQLA
jgi:hypothetical protein